jgi:hypothetical protein
LNVVLIFNQVETPTKTRDKKKERKGLPLQGLQQVLLAVVNLDG